ncbi:MAG: FeoB-associated Cys-rich membrane protein [Pedobacter sp.]|nr:MAG: FeoB-associated Cys-rich membrane protein [Pedobacter sp.]
MDLQFILVILLFLAALLYVGIKVYFTIFPKSNNCNSGCNKCAANFDHIPSPKDI